VDQKSWTEQKIGRAAVKADKAAMRKKWSVALKYGEKMLAGSIALYGSEDKNTIQRLKTLNRYYDKAGRLEKVPTRIKQGYLLAKKHFPPTHNTILISRLLYYKLLIKQKDFQAAIPLVYENIAILSENNDDQFKRLHYLGQLHGLYGATLQRNREENVLVQKLALNQQLVGKELGDNISIIMDIAHVYCQQQKIEDFKQLMQTYNLKFKC